MPRLIRSSLISTEQLGMSRPMVKPGLKSGSFSSFVFSDVSRLDRNRHGRVVRDRKFEDRIFGALWKVVPERDAHDVHVQERVDDERIRRGILGDAVASGGAPSGSALRQWPTSSSSITRRNALAPEAQMLSSSTVILALQNGMSDHSPPYFASILGSIVIGSIESAREALEDAGASLESHRGSRSFGLA